MIPPKCILIDGEYYTTFHPKAIAAAMRLDDSLSRPQVIQEIPVPTEAKPAKRIRQSIKPLLNGLESEYYELIRNKYPNFPPVRCQAKKFRLGNGIFYTPDLSVSLWPRPIGPSCETCFEVKGSHAFRGGFENLKVAASTYPEVRWLLVWKEGGEWKEQEVLS